MRDLVLRKAAGKVGRCGIDGHPTDRDYPRIAIVSRKGGALIDTDASVRHDTNGIAKVHRRNAHSYTVGQGNVTLSGNGLDVVESTSGSDGKRSGTLNSERTVTLLP